MGVNLRFENTNPDGGGGNFIDADCLCHFMVESVEEEGDGVKVKLAVVASTDKNQVGRTTDQKFFFEQEGGQYPGSNTNRLLGFACAVGLYNKRAWRAAQDAGNMDVEVEFANAVGMQLCGKVEMKTSAGGDKKFARLTRSWAVGDKEAASVPKDTELLRQAFNGKLWTSEGDSIDDGSAGNAGNGAKLPPNKPQSSPPARKPGTPARPPMTRQQPAAAGAGGKEDF